MQQSDPLPGLVSLFYFHFGTFYHLFNMFQGNRLRISSTYSKPAQYQSAAGEIPGAQKHFSWRNPLCFASENSKLNYSQFYSIKKSWIKTFFFLSGFCLCHKQHNFETLGSMGWTFCVPNVHSHRGCSRIEIHSEENDPIEIHLHWRCFVEELRWKCVQLAKFFVRWKARFGIRGLERLH